METYGHCAYILLHHRSGMTHPYISNMNDLNRFKSGLKTHLFKLFTNTSASHVFGYALNTR